MEEIAPVWYILTGDHVRLDDKEVVEVTYYIGAGDQVNSFYLSPDDTLDLIIEVQE